VSALLASFGLLAFASAATAQRNDTLTIGFLITPNNKAGWEAVAANFQRVYPDIRVEITYAANNDSLYQTESTQLAAGNATEVLATTPGCGTPIAICKLAKAGYLTPMVKKPWASKARSVPLVTSYTKYGKLLYGFQPLVAPYGIFTNDTMLKRLGLTVPQTYSQLLDACARAKANGTSAVIIPGGSPTAVTFLIESLALPLVYAKDAHWTGKLKAGKVTFRGSSGWRKAMQRFIDMDDAGCFQPGATGVTSGTAASLLFAQGRGLMYTQTSNNEGAIAASNPDFSYSFHPIPTGARPADTTTFLSLLQSLSVNAHASPRKRAARFI
jgi:raffinose/stachyose/melibiose transport system substrate-binding protein